MRNNDGMEPLEAMAYVAVATVVSVILTITGISLTSRRYQAEAITRGFAQYNPTNGVWEWRKP